MSDTFTVVYQTGGSRGTWRRGGAFATFLEARRFAQGIEQMGYPAYAKETRFWDIIGLPMGPAPHWDYRHCKPKNPLTC